MLYKTLKTKTEHKKAVEKINNLSIFSYFKYNNINPKMGKMYEKIKFNNFFISNIIFFWIRIIRRKNFVKNYLAER